MESEMSRMDSVEEPPSQASRLIAKVVPSFLQRAFPDPSLEHLYQSYRGKQKKADIATFFLAFHVFNLFIELCTINMDDGANVLFYTSFALECVGALCFICIVVIVVLLQVSTFNRDFLHSYANNYSYC
jgi:hypothetical protein